MKHVMKIFIIFLVFSLSGISFAAAESANDTFFKANRFYDDGSYKDAALLYERLISQGVTSGNIYYNLGNAYYKMGKIGKALLNYERAKKFIPDNEDLFANVSFMKSALDVEQPQETYSLYQKIWRGIRGAVSVSAWFVISAVLFFSICLILGIGFMDYRFRAKSHTIAGTLLFVFILSFVCFIDAYSSGKNFKEGIIISREADVRYSPSYSGVVAFKLVEGMKAQIIRKQDAWTHIRLNKEKSGWVESEAIEAVW
jgi:tetratricopeptide (TPR) repeat protein